MLAEESNEILFKGLKHLKLIIKKYHQMFKYNLS